MVSRHDIPTSGVPGRVPVNTTKSLVGCLITVARLWSVEVSETINEYREMKEKRRWCLVLL